MDDSRVKVSDCRDKEGIMTITIMKLDDEQVVMKSKAMRFKMTYVSIQCYNSEMYQLMEDVSDWCNNTLNEECLFEVE